MTPWQRDRLSSIRPIPADKWQAARDFWQAMYDGMAEAFAQGMTEPNPKSQSTILSPAA